MKIFLIAGIFFAAGYRLSDYFASSNGSLVSQEDLAKDAALVSPTPVPDGSPQSGDSAANAPVNSNPNTLSIGDMTAKIGVESEIAIVFDTQHTPSLNVDDAMDSLAKSYSVQKLQLTSLTGKLYQAIVIFGFADRRDAEKAKPIIEQGLNLKGLLRYAPSCVNEPPDDEGFVCSDTSASSEGSAENSS